MPGKRAGAPPAHERLAEELCRLVEEERTLLGVALVRGAKLPTESELAAAYDVGRGTVRKALEVLAAGGLIQGRRGGGTRVTRRIPLELHTHAEHPDRQGSADAWFSEVLRSGRKPSQEFGCVTVEAPEWVASELQVRAGDPVVLRTCLRYVDDDPWSRQDSYYPMDVALAAGLTSPDDIAEGTIRRLAASGYREVGWRDTLWSRRATAEEAKAFGMAPGISVTVRQRLAMTRLLAVRFTCEVLPGDRNRIIFVAGDVSAWRAVQ